MKTKDCVRVLFVGDVFGSGGIKAVQNFLPELIKTKKIDLVVINAENASAGIGVSEEDAKILFDSGADVLTGGNHSLEKRDYWQLFEKDKRVLRPDNFPKIENLKDFFTNYEKTTENNKKSPLENEDVSQDSEKDLGFTTIPGSGCLVLEKNNANFVVLNLQGRENMHPLDCPFRCADEHIKTWESNKEKPIILVDFHAESTMEKEAFALYLNGRVSAVVGTHTHVQTADERILSNGTAYITDLGMTGPENSVIGSTPELAIKRSITQVLYRMEISENPSSLRGLIVDIEKSTAKAISVKRINLK